MLIDIVRLVSKVHHGRQPNSGEPAVTIFCPRFLICLTSPVLTFIVDCRQNTRELGTRSTSRNMTSHCSRISLLQQAQQ